MRLVFRRLRAQLNGLSSRLREGKRKKRVLTFGTEIDFYVREPAASRIGDCAWPAWIVSVFLNEGILFQSLADCNRANHCDYATTLVHGTSLRAHVPKWSRTSTLRCAANTHVGG